MTEEKEQKVSETEQVEQIINETSENLETVTDEVTEASNELEQKQQEIETLQAEKAELDDRLLRLQAELANIQRRQAKERQDLLRFQSQKLATELLPVLDNLERALAIEVDTPQGEALKKGIEMAYSSFLAAFQAENIQQIDAMNKSFDPTYHHAVQQVPATENQESDTVVQVLQSGYQLHERVIRPAMVVVSN